MSDLIERMLIAVVDTETTGEDPTEGAEVVEVAVVIVEHKANAWWIASKCSTLVHPTKPIPPQARAVHHIDDEAFDREGCILQEDLEGWVERAANVPDAWCAHNAAFDKKFIQRTFAPWICTMQCAKHLWPTAPAYGLQVLRYHLGLNCSPPGLPHRAMYDTLVAAHLLIKLLDTLEAACIAHDGPGLEPGEQLAELVKLTTAPVLLKTCGFGKHRGTPWADVPRDYMRWVLKQGPEPDGFSEDVRYTCQHHLGLGTI